MMKIVLLLLLLLADLPLISSGQGVTYCVKPNTTATCGTEDPCQQCQTLQDYLKNVTNTTINLKMDLTIIFMDGSHIANFCGTVTVSAPILNIVAKGKSNTVMLSLCWNNVNKLTFKSTNFSLNNFNISGLSGLGNPPQEVKIMIMITAIKVVLSKCAFQFNFPELINFTVAERILVEDCTFNGFMSFTIPSLMITAEHMLNKRNSINVTLESCKFIDTKTKIAGINNNKNYYFAVLKDCKLNNSWFTIANAKHAILDGFKLFKYATVSFVNCSAFFDDINIVLKDIYLEGAVAIIEDCNVNIIGDSIFNASNVVARSSSSITMSGNISLQNYHNLNGAMLLDSSSLIIAAGANVTFYNNTAVSNGGALHLIYSSFFIQAGASANFINNSANNLGGAIYIYPGISTAIYDITVEDNINSRCLFRFINSSTNETYIKLKFANNSAINGSGDDVYGATLKDCQYNKTDVLIKIDGVTSPSFSSVSSDPQRVCLCDKHGVPQCEKIYNPLSKVYPGESFTISVIIVGWDYQNATTGVIYANFLGTDNSITPTLDSNSQRGQVISNSRQCTNFTFTLYSKSEQNVTMYITSVYSMDAQIANKFKQRICQILTIQDNIYCNYKEHLTPVFFDFTFLQCPAGFNKPLSDSQSCDCRLRDILLNSCTIKNGIGYFSWNKTVWVGIEEGALLYSALCPFGYCNMTVISSEIHLPNDSDSQCAFNRAGRLCGGCKDNYSLAIGSSHCILCPNNNNLALLIFFAAAGFLLVFFISAFNLTVTQGMINGLIFYANIVWTYQSIFFPQELVSNPVLTFLKTFIAWVNLDFGIETCFVNGLNALWKTELQFIFPLYIWIIAGLIIAAAKYSTRMTNLLGNRGVPVLETLLLLSYAKLLQTSFSIMEFSTLTWENQSTVVVWTVDGNINYTDTRHILLLVAGVALLLFFLLPYTVLLFLIQCFRKISDFCLLKWITKLHPVFDAYFASLKHKHQYWFGVCLIARVVVLATFVTFNIPDTINIYILFVVGTSLLSYVTFVQPYKNIMIQVLHNSFLVNLVLLSGTFSFIMAFYKTDNTTMDTANKERRSAMKTAAIMVSTGIAFLQFCSIVLYPVCAAPMRSIYYRYYPSKKVKTELDSDNESLVSSHSIAGYRDSILNESEPLLPTY